MIWYYDIMYFQANLSRLTRRREHREKFNHEFPQITLNNYN